ncbi:MAG TPA: 6-phosphogluconolactonase [Solirubrobacteraceae bacterium]|nr:6-phosphogluconolactonase [Solirubrobacteraceae bacterium]
MAIDIEVVDDPGRACAAMLVGVAAGGGDMVLTGGSTPRAAYGEFVDAVQTVGIDVTRCTLWFSDERCVAPDDERSNYGMVRDSLLDPLGESAAPVVHRMQGELGPEAAATEYERQLRAAGPPRFDLVLLGIGPDGHLASMFPDQSSLSERSRLVLGVHEAGWEPYVPRVTLTFPALVNARQIVFLATGENKAGPVAAAFGPNAKPDPHVPSSLLPPMAKEVKVLLDRDAAAGLGSNVLGPNGSGPAGSGAK